MDRNLPSIMEHIYHWEGDYVNHPSDPGGATNMGITIRTLSDWLGRPATVEEVKALDRTTADRIYKKNYWNKVRGKYMPDGVDAALMDAAVNSGPRASVRWLQRALGVSDDGLLGPITMGAVEATEDLPTLVNKMIDERLKSVRQFRNYNVFGRGWENRINSLRRLALELANGKTT